MIKKIFLLLSIVLILGVVAVGFFFSNLLSTSIVEGVNRFGPQLTQTEVTLDAAHISLLGGSGSLEKLFIGNPKGFTGERAIELGKVSVEVDTKSVFSDTVVIKKIHIVQPEISFEKTRGGSNLQALQKNIETATGGARPKDTAPESAEPETASDKPAKKVVIEHLIVEGAVVDVIFLGQTLSISLPPLEMRDIGKDQGGIDRAKAVALFMNELIGSIISAVTDEMSGLGNVGRELGKQVEGVGEEAEKALDNLKKLF